MPKTTICPLDLTAPQSRHLSEHRRLLVVSPCVPQPLPGMSVLKGPRSQKWLVEDEDEMLIEAVAPYQPGDIVPCRERWAISSSSGVLIDPCLNYEADGMQIPIVKFENFWLVSGRERKVGFVDWQDEPRDLIRFGDKGWQPARTMPLWAIRHRPVVESVECRRVSSITAYDVWEAGIGPLSPPTYHKHDDCKLKTFREWWRARYRRRGDAYSFDKVWGWFYTLVLKGE